MDKVIQGGLITVIILGSGYLAYSFVAPTSDTLVTVEESSESTNNCGEKPEFSKFLGIDPEEMQFYDPSQQELDAFNALLEEWSNCVETLDWQTYRNEELGFAFRYPKEWGEVESSLRKENSLELRELYGSVEGEFFEGSFTNNTHVLFGGPSDDYFNSVPRGGGPLDQPGYIERNGKYYSTVFPDALIEATRLEDAVNTKVLVVRALDDEYLGPHISTRVNLSGDKYEGTTFHLSLFDVGEELYEELIAEFIEFVKTIELIGGDDTSNWQTYRNSALNFEIKYPDSLINIEEDAVFKMKDHVTLFFPGCDVEFGEYTGRGFSPDIDMSRETIRVGGIEVEQTTWYWDETFSRTIEGRDRTSSNRNISASVSASEKNPSSAEVCFALFDQILSTFRFID